jgi:hypothetical protein
MFYMPIAIFLTHTFSTDYNFGYLVLSRKGGYNKVVYLTSIYNYPYGKI